MTGLEEKGLMLGFFNKNALSLNQRAFKSEIDKYVLILTLTELIQMVQERRNKYEYTVSQRIAEGSFDRRPVQKAGSAESGEVSPADELGDRPDQGQQDSAV